jgi:hypothetical protein
MVKYTLIFLLIILTYTTNAQQKGFEVGLLVGTSHYFGDLNTNFDVSHPGIGIHAIGRYNFNTRLAAKASLSYGRISGDDNQSNNQFQLARNLDFYSNVIDASLQMEFNFLPYEHGSYENYFTPYIFMGVAAFKYNPKTELEGTTYNLRDYGTEGQLFGEEYRLVQPAFAFGGGMKWDINYYWSINVEISARVLFTDYLDDVSKVYPDRDLLQLDRGETAVKLSDRSISDLNTFQLGETGRQRGNGKDDDSYNFISVGLVYYFGKVYCPNISRR